MKKIFGFLVAAAVLFGAASCAKEDISSSIANGETVEVTFTANLPELGTRAIGEGESARTLKFFVYEYQNDEVIGTYLSAVKIYTADNEVGTNVITSDSKFFNFSLSLIKGMKYNIVFWADKGTDSPYSVVEENGVPTGVISANYSNVDANDDTLDAFFGTLKEFDPAAADAQARAREIKLYRPFAQLNAKTNDIAAVTASGATLTKSSLTVKTYTTLDLFSGAVGDLANVTFKPNNVLDNNGYISMNYLLAPETKCTADVTFDYEFDGATVNFPAATYTYVPLQRNYKTNILGSLLTKSTDFTVEIKPGFVGTENVDIWDGKSVSEPSFDPQTNTYTVTNGAELAWVANEVNKYSNYEYPFKDVTIKLASSINLNGAEWTPIGDYRFSANRFCGTFDGQNHTISNFKITKKTDKNDSNKSSYGFFGNVEGTVKDLTIANATVNSYAYTGALVGRLNSGLIENCNVVDCTVSNTYWQGGILIGQVNGGSVKNCTVKNSSITSKSAIGAISGPATNETDEDIVFENCTVENCQINQTGSFGGSYDKYFGTMFGYLKAAEGKRIIINNCTATNTTVKGNSNAMFSGDIDGEIIVNGGLPVSTADELDAALKAGGSYYLTNNIAVTEKTYQNVDFTLDGNGYTISQVEGSTNNFALFDSVTGKITLKNIVFDGVKGGAVLRTTGAELTMDNVTVKNCEHTLIYGLIRLIGKNVIKNCKFENNKCTTVITFNTEGDDNTDPQLVQNCEFKNNTCSATAVVHYSTGGSATIDGNKFVNNTLNVSNGATLYMGFKRNCTVTNNLFEGNTVTATSKRSSGGLMIGNTAVVTGNSFVNNTVTVNGQTGYGNNVCASPYYAAIDLSGNYWGGYAPVENDDYYKEYNNYEVIINDYLTANPFN